MNNHGPIWKQKSLGRLLHDTKVAASYIVAGELASWKKIFDTPKPKVINFQVNDVCNAKCVFCNIWTQKGELEITSERFTKLLRDPFFSEVEHVGITGGEPTIKSNLPDYYEAVIAALPKLTGSSFITNGLLPDKAIPIYSEINRQYQTRGLYFGGMVSIDGIGQVHDRVRGTPGAFAKATETVWGLKSKGISVIVCCTIIKENVYGLHDLLQWGRENGIYIRFRVADFIKRLYNDNLGDQIRNFDRHEIKHLVSFFYMLLTEYETDEQVKKTYSSILSLLTGGRRLIRCPYQSSEAIFLDSRGMFAHCAPKGVPYPLDSDARRSMARHKVQRVKIRLKNCSSCIHDYHADWTTSQAWLVDSEPGCDQIMYGFKDQDFPDEERPSEEVNVGSLKEILLVGWYGTETAGDVAILLGIIEEYLEKNPKLQFILFSLYPYYTKLAVSEMESRLSSRVKVLSYHGMMALRAAHNCDSIMMAGGPLMDIPQTRLIASLFLLFCNQGKHRIIEGCGIGPLNIEEYRRNVLHIVRLASQVSVRDQSSQRLLQSLGIKKTIQVRNDPSETYVTCTKIQHIQQGRGMIRCFLRELTAEYPQAITLDDATQKIKHFLFRLIEWYPQHQIELWSMHYFPIGNDDRLYAKKIAGDVGGGRILVDYEPRSPLEILQAMAEADFCVCMRFHSVVFAATIGTPFIAIDYTAGGKIRGFLEDNHQSFKCVSLDQLDFIEKGQLNSILAIRQAGR